MQPIRVTAHLSGEICLPNGPPALDALLTWAEATRRDLPPPATADECVDLPIPIQRSECGRYYLASFGQYIEEGHNSDWTNRRFPIPEAQMLGGPKVRRLNITSGPSKSYRIPRVRTHLVDDKIDWWAIGDVDGVRDLLGLVSYLAKRRGVGLGKVRRWEVAPSESWGEGFPVLRNGFPTRPLPIDAHGVSPDAQTMLATIAPPYWAWARRVEAYVP